MKKRIITISTIIIILAVFSVAFFLVYTNRSAFADKTAIIWDGTTVATSFHGGNGTEDNPYLINDGTELAYLKQLLDGTEAESYNYLYYRLTDNINLGSNPLGTIGNKDVPFTGTLDGDGYTIENITIKDGYTDEDITYYGIFKELKNATIKDLNIDKVNYILSENKNIRLSTLAPSITADELEDGQEPYKISNVSITNVTIDTKELDLTEESTISLFANNISEGYEISNMYLQGIIESNNNKGIGIISNNNESKFDNVITNVNTELEIDNFIETKEDLLTNIYKQVDDKFYLEEEEVNIDDLLDEWNLNNEKEYEWIYDDGILFLNSRERDEENNRPNVRPFKAFSFTLSPALTEHASGLDDNTDTVYVNDLESDADYYEGLNYTDWKAEGTIPNFTKKTLYDNLAKVYIKYSGTSIDDNTVTGFVSKNEQYSNFIYYKYYPIENGKVKIPLIDNPYADRPRKGDADLVFNGWITDYEGAEISIDMDTYDRYVTVDAPNGNNAISITMYAVWTKGAITQITSSKTIASAESDLTTGMVNTRYTRTFYTITDFSPYFLRGTIARREYFPTGARNQYDEDISGDRCNSRNGCTYYYHAPATYNPNYTYYTLHYYYGASVLEPDGQETINSLTLGNSLAGYFKSKKLTGRNVSTAGYYSNTGELYEQGDTCNNCTVYELIQFYDDNNNPITYEDETEDIYYLTTRDTNIIVLRASLSTSSYRYYNTKPLTITSLHNDVDYREDGSINLANGYIQAGADLRVEYVRTTGNIAADASNNSSPPGDMEEENIFGGYNNLKVGRGIEFPTTTTRVNADSVIAGNLSGTGSSDSLTKYKLIVESGKYNHLSVTGGSNSSRTTQYVDGTMIAGCDFDRIDKKNDKLNVYHSTAGGWGGNIRSSSSNTSNKVAATQIIKSGSYGTSKADYSCGVYAGGRGTVGSYHYAPRQAIIEGGYIYNLIGGALSSSGRSGVNDAYLFVKGGSVDLVIGGAGVSETYGNRIVSVTGGQVNYGVFGGSNGTTGDGSSSRKGTLDGDTFVYIGGHAKIGGGNEDGLFGVDPGNVFGAGNGNSSVTTIGSVNNSNVLINGGTIEGKVFGGGNFGAIGTNLDSGTTKTKLIVQDGTIKGSVYGGSNKNGAGTSNVTATIDVEVKDGTINGSVYGGSCTKGIVYGSTNVKINGGTVKTDVYGGGEGGHDDDSDGTYIRDNVTVTIGDTSLSTTPRVEGNVYGGSAFGTVNGTTENGSANSSLATTVTVNKGTIVKSVFGGSKGGTVTIEDDNGNTTSTTYTPKEYGNITVNINGGTIGSVFGGNDALGSPSADDKVYLYGGTIGNVYGGGNNTGQTTTKVYQIGSTVTNNIYGGSNESGTVTTTNVQVNGGTAQNVFGGNNLGGTVTTSNVYVSNGTVSKAVYGGGNKVGLTTSNVTIVGGNINTVYGGSNELGDVTTSNVRITNTSQKINSVYGGNNSGGTTITANVTVTTGTLGDVYGGGNKAVTSTTKVIIDDGTITNVFGGGDNAKVTTSDVDINGGTIGNVYGGGNNAGVNQNTNVDINNAHITSDIYGGGNKGEVVGNTTVIIKNSSVDNNLYAGGNQGQVRGNTTVTVEDNSIIGTTSTTSPNGSVFGSGNSAPTGMTGSPKTATVNIVGGTIYGNVYGGANTSVVYGETRVNIGTSAVNKTGLTENNILIKGTVFGGGESNASGSPDYDWTAISVTDGIYVNINGDGYANNSHTFKLEGSIFGSGNASSSSGDSQIYIKSLGTRTAPSENISIQRTTTLTIDNSVIHLVGALDRTNKYDNILYSLNIIGVKDDTTGEVTGGLTLKNNSVLLLDENANKLATFTSAVDVNNNSTVTQEIAQVTIDDNTKTVTRNVDNRLYLLANKNLNIATDEDGKEYGKVTGMTFFGIYPNKQSLLDRAGIYKDNYQYGDASSTADLVVGSSYVLGLHDTNHDITKDGFYTNYLDEETNYEEIRTAYIEPTPSNTDYYRWQIGTNSVEYEFTMTASKYLSLGTYDLSMIDFPNGDTTFTLLGVDTSELAQDVELIDEINVPRIAPADAPTKQIGLSMKSETTEWTAFNTTKFLSQNNGKYTGDETYLTNSDAGSPELMFYLYHPKNIKSNAELGKVIITMEAAVPNGPIDFTIKLVTIKVKIESVIYTEGNRYDASISYGKKYSMPVTTKVNITNRSQFTEYYSMYGDGSITSVYGNNLDYYRTLISDYVLPVGTTITLIDTSKDTPKYYYYTVDQAVYNAKTQELANNNEVTYRFSDFISMDSTTTTNKYNDHQMNQTYFYSDLNACYEEFLLIFDFKNTNITEDHLNNEMLLEMRNQEDRTVVTVIERRLELRDMVFNIYNTTNLVLKQTVTEDVLNYYYDIPHQFQYKAEVTYSYTQASQKIIDTNYEESSMGMNVKIYNNEGNQVTATSLAGSKITINNTDYFTDSDGVFRIKLTDKVTNIIRNATLTIDSLISEGNYTIEYSLVASSDGLHTSDLEVPKITKNITIIGTENNIIVRTNDKSKLYYLDKAQTELKSPVANYQITYNSLLQDTNLRLSIFRRDTSTYNSTNYEEVEFNKLFTNTSTLTNSTTYPYEVEVALSPSPYDLPLTINPDAKTGTYKLVFKLCDGNQAVDTDIVYLIVKESVE